MITGEEYCGECLASCLEEVRFVFGIELACVRNRVGSCLECMMDVTGGICDDGVEKKRRRQGGLFMLHI